MPPPRFGFTLMEWAIIVLVIAVFMAHVVQSGDGWQRAIGEGAFWLSLTVIVSLVLMVGSALRKRWKAARRRRE